jgi:ribosomal protein S6
MQNEKTNTEGDKATVYEMSFLFLPSLAFEQVSQSVSAIKEAVSGLGGEVISYEDPILIDLAYPMTKVVGAVRHKVGTGYFGWVKFEMLSEKIGEIKKMLDTNDGVIRHLIIKTIRENTLLNGRMILRKDERIKKEKENEEVEAAATESSTPEEIDKSIDELVIE